MADTPKPQGKVCGKRAREKQEFQSKLLEVLQKDMSMPDDDPVDMMLLGIGKRMRKSLPEEEQFSLIHKIQGCVNDHITAYKRGVMVASTNLDTAFLAPGASNVNVSGEAVHTTLQVQNEPPPPPPMVRAGQRNNNTVQPQHHPGFFERKLSFQEM